MNYYNSEDVSADWDFIGFSFGGVKSQDLGIYRISDGDFYEESLVPNIKNYTVDIPGGDGKYYFGMNYEDREFNIKFAFDHLTEAHFRRLRQVFSGQEIKELIFDERPYVAYHAKVENKPSISYICFMEPIASVNGVTEQEERIYKGEGEINFVSYSPYGYSPKKDEGVGYKKYLNEYFVDNNGTGNTPQWQDAAGLLEAKGIYDGTGSSINVFNPGDVAAHYKLSFSSWSVPELIISCSWSSAFTFKVNGGASYVIDSEKQMITENGNPIAFTGEIFSIPPTPDNTTFIISGMPNNGTATITYPYRFL